MDSIDSDEVIALLEDIREELRWLRKALVEWKPAYTITFPQMIKGDEENGQQSDEKTSR